MSPQVEGAPTGLGPTPARASGAGEATSLSRAWPWLRPRLPTIVVPFVLVLYLALQDGGYGVIVRSEVGVAIWWLVLLGALAGLLPVTRIGRAGWLALGLLTAFAAWTALAISWSDSSERGVLEVARVLTYVGVLALALAAQRRDALRSVIGAVGAAIACVAVLSLLSRLEPGWFPADQASQFLTGPARLNYPVNYWNGLAALMAVGMPLVLVAAAESRRLLTQAIATAALPVMALTAFYTLSRGGAGEIAVGLVAVLALHPRRLALLPTLALAVAGSALAIGAALQRDALLDALGNSAASEQGDQMLAVMVVVCGGVALLRVAIGLAARHGLGPRPVVSRARAATLLGAVAVVALIGAVAAGVPSELSDRWEQFKEPTISVQGAERFESSSGRGRYQTWQAALDANASEPLIGIGPGTYEFWWSREGTLPGFVRDAHSLYLETLAELGWVGLLLLAAALAALIVPGLRAALSGSPQRAWLAGALGSAAAFLAAAAIDWAWEMAVIPVAFLLVAAALVRSGARSDLEADREAFARPVLVALAIASLVAISIPLLSATSVRDSQAAVRSLDLEQAEDDAAAAGRIQPYAATPDLQSALVLEQQGDLDAAAAKAREATREEALNWRTWLILSRIEAERGKAGAAVEAYRRARSLNPRSPVFSQ